METEIPINNLPYWLDFVGTIVSSLAWPLAILFIVYILRNSIEKLISKITNLNKLTSNGIELEFFSEQIQEVKIAVEDETKDETNIQNLENSNLEYISEMAKIYPTAAVIESWKWVEDALSIKLYGHTKPINSMKEFYKLFRNNYISNSLFSSITKFRNIRNEASHYIGHTLTTEDALSYLQITDEIINYINNINLDDSSDVDE